jgi:hypothetical protein
MAHAHPTSQVRDPTVDLEVLPISLRLLTSHHTLGTASATCHTNEHPHRHHKKIEAMTIWLVWPYSRERENKKEREATSTSHHQLMHQNPFISSKIVIWCLRVSVRSIFYYFILCSFGCWYDFFLSWSSHSVYRNIIQYITNKSVAFSFWVEKIYIRWRKNITSYIKIL